MERVLPADAQEFPVTPTPPTATFPATDYEPFDHVRSIEELEHQLFFSRSMFDGVCPHAPELTAAGLDSSRLCLAGLCHDMNRVCAATAAELADPGTITLAS